MVWCAARDMRCEVYDGELRSRMGLDSDSHSDGDRDGDVVGSSRDWVGVGECL